MRKIPFYIALAASVLAGFSACSDNDDVADANTSNEGTRSFISVNIINPSAAPASGAKQNPLTRAAGYQNGTAQEGNIKDVRFYFFNDDGSPYILTNSNPANVNWLHYDISSSTEVQNSPTTTERYTNAILVIDGQTGTAPSFMIAVANPDAITNATSAQTSLLGDGSLSNDQLTAHTLLTSTFADANGNMLMTNSVYGETSTKRIATPTTGHIKTNRDTALAKPVNIYVERLAAKVTITHSDDNKWSEENVGTTASPDNRTLYNLGYCKYINGANIDSVEVYAAIKGVGLADEQRFGNIIKNINDYETWGGQLGFNPWYSADYHRSFWEVSPSFSEADNDNPIDYTFNDYTSGFYNATSGTGVFYTMPNTHNEAQTEADANRNSNRTYRTKVLLAANLMYKDNGGTWHPAEICTYRGGEYLGQEAVKTLIATQLYGRISKKDGNTFRNIQASDIEFVTPPAGSSKYKSYEVIPQFVDRDGDFAVMSADAANAAAAGTVTTYKPSDTNTTTLDDVFYSYTDKAEVRKDGDAYYYTTIRHLGTDPAKLGYFGVVRNHWYQVNVNSLKGFGTPVFNPDEPIVPVTPSDEDSYMAAQINVLQWRVVSQDVDIDGTAK